jgi:hypothetical protein
MYQHCHSCHPQEVARLAEEINTSLDNIGARRLHTVLERILEQISFDAPDKARRTNPVANPERCLPVVACIVRDVMWCAGKQPHHQCGIVRCASDKLLSSIVVLHA